MPNRFDDSEDEDSSSSTESGQNATTAVPDQQEYGSFEFNSAEFDSAVIHHVDAPGNYGEEYVEEEYDEDYDVSCLEIRGFVSQEGSVLRST